MTAGNLAYLKVVWMVVVMAVPRAVLRAVGLVLS
jgi:hypothetical protein